MSHKGKTQIVIMWTVGPDDVAEGDRIFASHGEWMKGHPRQGDVALLDYTISKGPELSNPLDPNSEHDLRAQRVLRVTVRHRQTLAGRDGQLARPVRRDGVERQGHGSGGDTAQRHGCPSTLVKR